jgi:hypothetical protein
MTTKTRTLCRFNNEGIHAFSLWLEKPDASVPPVEMLENSALIETIAGGGEIEIKAFDRKYEMGAHIRQHLGPNWETALDDAGLLAWLSLAFHESTMVNSAGKPYLGQQSRHLIATDNQWKSYTHSHRHLVRSSIFFAGHFGSAAQVFLAGHPSQHSKIEEQIGSRKTEGLPFSQAIADALFKLYFDPEKKAIRRGAASNTRGAIERFVKVIRQLDLTFDVHGQSGDGLVQLLPGEFARFLGKPTPSS